MRPAQRAALLAAFIAALAGGRPAAAQQLEPPRPRQGYYVAAGLLGSVQHITDDGVVFGVNLAHARPGRVSVGDRVLPIASG